MFVTPWRRRGLVALSLAAAVAIDQAAYAQLSGAIREDGVSLRVSGLVERVFTSDDREADARLVQLALKGVELVDASAAAPGARVPAPGEVMFVSVDARGVAAVVPRAGATIRATVRAGGRGEWIGDGPGWFEQVDAGSDAAGDVDSPGAGPRGSVENLDVRGMSCQAKIVRGRIVLEVISVASEGPAQGRGSKRATSSWASPANPFDWSRTCCGRRPSPFRCG